MENLLWWQGPKWLQLEQPAWPAGQLNIEAITEALKEAGMRPTPSYLASTVIIR